jgi:hypothetical protein
MSFENSSQNMVFGVPTHSAQLQIHVGKPYISVVADCCDSQSARAVCCPQMDTQVPLLKTHFGDGHWEESEKLEQGADCPSPTMQAGPGVQPSTRAQEASEKFWQRMSGPEQNVDLPHPKIVAAQATNSAATSQGRRPVITGKYLECNHLPEWSCTLDSESGYQAPRSPSRRRPRSHR